MHDEQQAEQLAQQDLSRFGIREEDLRMLNPSFAVRG